jgi:hypothetical protein
LSGTNANIELRAVVAQSKCEELDGCIRAACAAIAEARRVRRSKDVSFQEDIRLTREEHEKLHLVIKHLLVGHEGRPCPAGERPIVSVMKPWRYPAGIRCARPMKTRDDLAERRESA